MSVFNQRPLSRRQVLHHGSAAAVFGTVSRALGGRWDWRRDAGASRLWTVVPAEARGRHADPDAVRALALRAIDAARDAGASYADVRLTRTLRYWGTATRMPSYFSQHIPPDPVSTNVPVGDFEMLGIGVRALVNGYWGFAASPYWDAEEAVRLGREAASQATVNARGPRRTVEWVQYPVASGHWTMPVQSDPFLMPLDERYDLQASVLGTAEDVGRASGDGATVQGGVDCMRQERAVATSDGAYFTQTVYETGGTFSLYIFSKTNGARASAIGLDTAGRGWELWRDARILDQLPRLIEEAQAFDRLARSGVKPVDVGRYDLVCNAALMANLVAETLGRATQVDRALGYEANASGTSYLGPDPLTQLGTTVAASGVSVSADRSLVGGLATVRWDDEGVVPTDTPLVQDGVLVDYQTTREQAAWLDRWYQSRGTPVHSHGHAGAEDALSVTLQMTPNLSLAPSASSTTFADLIAGTKKGLAIFGGGVGTDFQAKNGEIRPGLVREITNGKLGSLVNGVSVLFDAATLWKSVTAVGGDATTETVAMAAEKGQPEQRTKYTVRAVPAAIKNAAIFDRMRKA